MVNNKARFTDGTVLIDLTEDAAAVSNLAYGTTTHDNFGSVVTGTLY